MTTLVWFRQDLRLADNPALHAAAERGPVVPVYVESFADEGEWAPGGASRWWLHQSLSALARDLAHRGSRLLVARGSPLEVLIALARECGATAITWTRRYEPAVIARDTRVKEGLRDAGLDAQSFNGALLAEPWTIANQSGRPFQVFTPFYKQLLRQLEVPEAIPAPTALLPPAQWPSSLPLDALALLPRIDWYREMAATWTPGEAGALEQLERFVDTALDRYRDARDRPAIPGTSRLSPHLHFGEVSPWTIWRRIEAAHAERGIDRAESRASKYFAELIWREFSHHLLHHFPHTPTEPLRTEFARFPWHEDARALGTWQRGRTGIPLVDAGMRELWATGWMHNRVRMVVASLLVKNLRLDWRHGARWFWDTLADADLANNTQGWQWTSGCGADAAPYFRIFNPVSQGERFDPDGAYVRRWVPELADVALAHIHAPWLAPSPPRDYPPPIVDLKASREAALAAYQSLRGR